MTQSWKAYELLTKTVFEQLAKLEGWKTLEVTHNKLLTNSAGAEHQIDVYIRYELLGREQEMVIECKDFQNPVDKPRFMSFVGVVTDLARVQGLFVTRTGFDRGNIDPIARAHNIGLYVLNENDEPDNKFEAALFEHVAQIVNIGFEKDFDPDSLSGMKNKLCEDWHLYDKHGNLQSNLQLLMDQAFDQMITRNVLIGEHITLNFHELNEMFFYPEGEPKQRVKVLGVSFQRQRSERARTTINSRLTHLLQVVTNNKKYYVHEDGTVYAPGAELKIPIVFESVGPKGENVVLSVVSRIRE